jgi:hypothetical protein
MNVERLGSQSLLSPMLCNSEGHRQEACLAIVYLLVPLMQQLLELVLLPEIKHCSLPP